MGSTEREQPDVLLTIGSTAFSLGICLTVIRAHVIGFGLASLRTPFTEVPRMLIGACYDLLFVVALAGCFAVALYAARRRPAVRKGLVGAFVAACLLTLALSLANVKSVQFLGRPLNYQWLYYADFLRSLDARQALAAIVSWHALLVFAGLGAVLIAGAHLLKRGLRLLLGRYLSGRVLLAGLALLGLLYFPFSSRYLARNQWDVFKLENPVVSFLTSVFARDTPSLFTMATPVGADDFRVAAERPAARTSLAAYPEAPQIRNVLFYVLESVPASLVPAYGGAYPVTPELDRYLGQAARFEHIYTPAPASNKALISLLCAVYPWISYYSLTQEHPDIPLSSLSGVLKAQGYRTGFFYSSDLTYQSIDRFLQGRGFDVIQDYRSRTCQQPLFVNERSDWRFLDGSDDGCTAEALQQWIDAQPEQPFFAVLWTMMTHYPYFSPEHEIDFGVGDAFFNRYLNALRRGDQALGGLLHYLEEKGLAASTLVVVVGDHGEAFGQHGQFTHASGLYEESIHVPLLLINPRLFRGEAYPRPGGLIDVAPTVLDLLHLPLPGDWQGRSLFEDDRSPRVYFFAPWSAYLFGYREGNDKFIFNASENTYAVYDLEEDPGEFRPSAQVPDAVKVEIQQRLAAWVQYQHRLIEKLTKDASVP